MTTVPMSGGMVTLTRSVPVGAMALSPLGPAPPVMRSDEIGRAPELAPDDALGEDLPLEGRHRHGGQILGEGPSLGFSRR